MEKNQAKQRIEKLKETINHHRYLYHVLDKQEISDSALDSLKKELFDLENQYPNLITEFHLYSGFVLSRYGSYKELYNKDIGYSVINIADWEADNFDQLFAHMNSNNTLLTTVSIHRRAYKDLSTTQIKQWVDFLIEKNLVCDNLETCNLLNTYIK